MVENTELSLELCLYLTTFQKSTGTPASQAHHRHDISARPSALGKWQLLEAKYHVAVLSLRVYDKHFDFLEPKGLQQSNMVIALQVNSI